MLRGRVKFTLALLIGLTSVNLLLADDSDHIPVTRWVDSSGRMPITYREYYSLHPRTTLPFEIKMEKESPVEGRDSSLVFVIVNSSLYPEVSSSVAQYFQDLVKEGYQVRLYISSGGTPSDLRSFLKNHLTEGLTGCVLVGDLPIPWYQMHEDWGEGDEYEEFPIDLYYMDLDGLWIDSNSDGMFDRHIVNLGPEIWIGRLTASPLIYSGELEATLVNNYFRKNHKFRLGNLPIERRALLYVDDDWVPWCQIWDNDLSAVYAERNLVTQGDVTVAEDYKGRLTDGYEFVQLHAHSSPFCHYFKVGGEWSGGAVGYQSIVTIDPTSIFYNLFACSNCRYVEQDYMGGWYVFSSTYGLGAIGSTKTGAMLHFNDFYTLLSQNKSLGESFKEWFALHGETSRQWFYGLTLLGDPTLKLRRGILASSPEVDDDASGNSIGNGNGRINSGERIELGLTLENCDTIEHRYVWATISSRDSLVDIIDSTAFYGDLPGHGTVEGSDNFVFSVSPSCPDDHRIVFLLDVRGEGGSRWKSYFGLPVSNPVITYFANSIVEVEGNHNGRADPGETCSLFLTLKNDGGEDAVELTTTISTKDPFLTFIDNQGVFQDIPEGALGINIEDPFRFVVNRSSPIHLAYCILHIAANDGSYLKDIRFGIEIGEPQVLLVVDDGEMGNTPFYSQVLDSMGVVYRKFVNTEGSVPPATLMKYKNIIWFTGEECGNTLTEDDRAHLKDYLDQGGHLFLTGQWGLYDIRDTDFYSDYLHADYSNFSTGLHHLNGVRGNPIVDSLSVSLSTTDPNGQICPGEIDPIPPAFSIFKYDTTTQEGSGDIRSTGTGAIGVKGSAYRLVFFGFGFEGIEPFEQRVRVMKGVLDWLEGRTGIGGEFGNRSEAPSTYSLAQNYPNPFNGATVLNYTIPQVIGEGFKVKGGPNTSHLIPITLKVYNILGQEVRTLVDEEQPAGYYQILWDGRDKGGNPVSSGVYFYRLKAGGFSDAKRMVLLR